MPLDSAAPRRTSAVLPPLLALALGLGQAALAAEPGVPRSEDGPLDGGRSPPGPGAARDGPLLAAEAAAPEADLPEPANAPSGPLSPVERLRIRLLGGNPIFALDWLASGADAGPPRPRLPLP